jgi:hypothetical protein
MRQIAGSFAQYEKARLVAKLRAARERVRHAKGKCEGRKSYEERDPELVRQAKRLRRRSAKGHPRSLREVARELAAMATSTRAGAPTQPPASGPWSDERHSCGSTHRGKCRGTLLSAAQHRGRPREPSRPASRCEWAPFTARMCREDPHHDFGKTAKAWAMGFDAKGLGFPTEHRPRCTHRLG